MTESRSPGRQLVVCVNRRLTGRAPCCGARGGEEILGRLRERAAARGLDVEVVAVHCFGQCARGPNVRLAPGGAFVHGARSDRIDEIIDVLLGETTPPRG